MPEPTPESSSETHPPGSPAAVGQTPASDAAPGTGRTPDPPRRLSWPTLRLLRPKQWIKNGFVFAPLLFADRFRDPTALGRASAAFGLACLVSSAVYIFNDWRDREPDREHPQKRWARPIAAGAIAPRRALILAVLLASAGLAGGLVLSFDVFRVIAAYLLVGTAYTLWLKHVVVLDLFAIAALFILRVLIGGLAIPVPLSVWILLCTGMLALYLAATKRLRERQRAGAPAFRGVLADYTPELLRRYVDLAAMAAVTFYGLYAVTARPAFAWTIPFVMFGIFRYAYLAEAREAGESPADALLGDAPLAICVIAWAALCAVLVG